MDDHNKKDGMGNCSCGCMGCMGHGMMRGNMCCGGGWGRYHHVSLLRIGLFLVILGFVFSFGVKLGEFKASLEGEYGWGHRMMGGYGADENYYGPGMMHPLQGMVTQPSSAPIK